MRGAWSAGLLGAVPRSGSPISFPLFFHTDPTQSSSEREGRNSTAPPRPITACAMGSATFILRGLSFRLPRFSPALPTSSGKNEHRRPLRHYVNISSVRRESGSTFHSSSFPGGTESIREFHPQNNLKAKTCAGIFSGQSSWGEDE